VGRQANIVSVITTTNENIQETNLQVSNTEKGLKMSPGPSAYSDVAQGSAKALPVPPGLQHSTHSLPCKDPLLLFLGVVLA